MLTDVKSQDFTLLNSALAGSWPSIRSIEAIPRLS
jgi:hypothetical protein